ncbi:MULTISPECIES: FliH/SctL family protein [Spectribacter]|uniref:Flagellar assembly protein FliH n=2 Tax=Spectribacter TaxID=3160928 RepID=A0ABU3BW59_9GAMM|nr:MULTISPECIES: FliH/SctL family protein [unclassified Salinisphaera]MDT0618247.1 FliH/SctL family protein [Salinisphaera sp. P385]MDT0633381.1 FliH/SctL family protein [Salinisphaera sp. W335]
MSDAAVRWDMPLLADRNRRPRSAAELDAIADAARDEGYQAGLDQGREAGRAAMAAEAARLRTALTRLQRPLADLDADVEAALVWLAGEIGGALFGHALATDADTPIRLARLALDTLGHGEREVRLYVNATDFDGIRTALDADPAMPPVRLMTDSALGPGENRLETDSTVVDGSLKTRLDRIREQLLAGA